MDEIQRRVIEARIKGTNISTVDSANYLSNFCHPQFSAAYPSIVELHRNVDCLDLP